MNNKEMTSLITKERVIACVILIVLACGIFYGGVAYGKSSASSANTGRGSFGQNGQFAGRGGAGGFGGRGGGMGSSTGAISIGQVLSYTGNTLTLKLANGSSRIILVATSTPVTKSVPGTASDLQTGQNVMVIGMVNSDGTVTARSVQLQPAQPTQPGQPQS